MKIEEKIVANGYGALNASYFVVHETANLGSSALNHVKYWSGTPTYAVHYVGDWTGIVYHTVPDNRLCQQVGGGNAYVVGIELCHATNATDFKKVWDLGVEFSAYYLNKRGWGIDRLLSHNDCRLKWGGTDHTDPIGYFKKYGKTWAEFKSAVEAKMKGGSPIPSETPIVKTEPEKFIEKIAPYVQQIAPKYGIKCNSAVIAQACLESAYGTSNKAKYHNYFGLKYRSNRLTCDSGTFTDSSKEQNADGSYKTIVTKWYKFENMGLGVEGYFQFINIDNYKNLKGVTDPKTYLENIKKDNYASGIDYVQNNMAVVNKYNLTKYDDKIEPPKDDVTPTPKPTKDVPTITYAVKTDSWAFPNVKNGAVASGNGKRIVAIKIGVDIGRVEYRVHCAGRWLPKVSGNNWNDYNNGYAGDDKNPIDAVQIYYYSDTSQTPFYESVYSVKSEGLAYLPEVHDTNWEAYDGEHTAGLFGKPITEIKIKLVEC